MPLTLPPLLASLQLPQAIVGLSSEQKKELAAELRQIIIQVVAQNGGHLAPSLGVVELTIALLCVFNPPQDSIVWDVGHQSYPWKLLTGRAEQFDTLRQYGGISGFLKRSESPYDAFGAGHASTSISAALGIAKARDLQGGTEHVAAVIGDGALTGGMAFEALNQAGGTGKPFIVILNDNSMSISETVGALSLFLSRNLSNRGVMRVKYKVEDFLLKVPGGPRLLEMLQRGESSFKTFFTLGRMFEAFRFNYIGPVDGHNIEELITHLEAVKSLDRPALLHIRTQKGKGYAPAEENPSRFHGISCFEPDTGVSAPPIPSDEPHGPGFSSAFGQALCDLAESNEKIVAITAAMPDSTGLGNFQQTFPSRCVDVGICEEHAVTFAAGLASQGYQPVVAIYSTFLQRAFDQILHDVCLQNLPVVFCLDRAGLVGEDGATHHGAFDLSWLRLVPNLSVIAPSDEAELRDAVHTALTMRCPVAIRYPRGHSRHMDKHLLAAQNEPPAKGFNFLPPGCGEILLEGSSDVCIICIGHTAYCSVKAARALHAENGKLSTVFAARWVKPLPEAQILTLAKSHKALVLIEENTTIGGFSAAILELLADHDLLRGLTVKRLGLPDRFITHGAIGTLKKELGLDTAGIIQALRAAYAAVS